MPEIARVKYHHDAMIDMVIAEPSISQGEIAARFGFTQAWVSIIFNSDAFQCRLAERKGELVDPILRATVEDRLRAVANKAAERFLDRLAVNAPMSNKDLLEAMKVSTSGLGMGPKQQAPTMQQNLYVLPAPPPTPTTAQWAARAAEVVGEAQELPRAPE